MAEFILYSYWRSSCSYRVRIALYLKNLDFEYRGVHLLRQGGEQRKDDYLALNPMAEVPCLVHRGKSLAQSMAIITYLDHCRPQPRLFPEDPWQAAQVLQVCEMINAGIQPIQNLKVLQKLTQQFQLDEAGKAAWVRHWIANGFKALEAKLSPTAGRFCFGEAVSAADVFLVPQIYNAHRFGLDMNAYPTLQRVHTACEAMPAFQKAAPANQPDAE